MADGLSHNRKCALSTKTAQVSGAHTDFPALFTVANLPAEMFDADGSFPAQNGGGDIRFTSDAAGNTDIPADIVSFVTDVNPANGSAEIWVRPPNVRDTQVDTIYVWYNTPSSDFQPAVTAANGRNAVWTEAQAAVLMEDATPVDRSGNHTMSVSGTLTSIDGPFGKANSFSGNDRVSNSDAALEDVFADYDGTISIICRRTAYAADKAVAAFEGVDDLVIYPMDTSGGNGLRVFWRDVGFNIIDVNNESLANSWVWTDFTSRAANDHEAYTNGASVATSSASDPVGSTDFFNFYIGGFTAADQDFDGDIAQVIVWKTARTDGWISTLYNNQSDPGAFITVGTPESVGGGATVSANKGDHSHAADSGPAIPAVAVQAASAVHAHPSEAAVGIAQASGVAADGLHPHDAAAPAAIAQVPAAATDATHGHFADATSIGQAGQVGPLEAVHLLVTEAPILAPFAVGGPFDAAHGHLAAAAFATTESVVTPSGRRLVVPARRDTLEVAAEDRGLSPTA